MDNFYISHSEKYFLVGAGEGEGRVVHYRGTLSSQCGLDYIVNRIDSHSIILNKTTLIFSPSMPLKRIKTARKGGVTSYPHLPLRNPLDRAVGGILVPTESQSIR